MAMVQTKDETEGQAPVKKEGQAPVTKDGQAPVKKDGQAPVTKDGQAPVKKEGQAPVKKEKAPTPQMNKTNYCILCRKSYLRHEGQEHMHSMLHHRELDILLGRDSLHECQACKASSMGLNKYSRHVSTAQHKAKLKSLISKTSVKPVSLHSILSKETIARIIERNKMLKKQERKKMKKKNKKMKQEAAQRRGDKMSRKQKVSTARQKKSQQVNVSTWERPEQTQQKGGSKALVQNKENRLIGTRSQSQLRSQQSQSGQHVLLSEESPGRVRHNPHLQTQSAHSAHHKSKHDVYNFSANPDLHNFTIQCIRGKDGSFQTDRLVKRPKNTQGGATANVDQSVRSNINQHKEHYYGQYNSATDDDFTSDHPWSGAIIFDRGLDKSERSSQTSPGRGPHCSTTPTSASTSMCVDRSSDTSPIRDKDVSAMLWQIRRALGVREPCRADRVARSQKQINQVNVQEVGHSNLQQAVTKRDYPLGDCFSDKHTEEDASSRNTFHTSRAAVDNSAKAPSVQSLQVGTTAPVSSSNISTSKVTTVKAKRRLALAAKRRTFKEQEKAQQSEESSEVACVSDGQSNSRDKAPDPQGESAVPRLGTLASLNRCMGKTASAEPNLNAARRIRNVNESRKAEGEKEAGLKPTLQKLLSSSGAQRKVNWTEMYQEANRKKQVKGMPRFGIELINPLPDQEGLPQVEDEDLPLSEGFHWEKDFPDSLQPAPCVLPPLPQDTTDNDSITERQSESRMQDSSEQPGMAPGDGTTAQTAEVVHPVKVEPNTEQGENGNVGGNCNVKREKKHKMEGGVSNMEPCGKKRKTKSNKVCPADQDKMDQLLAVSLREDELSHSLEDLDNSLIQARNALQAVYAEVQRLLLHKQQFTAEVNSLRAKRIEILQGMQEGYSGESSVAENASLSLVGSAAALSSSSPYASNSTLQPPATPPMPISHPQSTSLALPSMSIKKEICEPAIDGQPSQPGKAVVCNTAAPQMPCNQGHPLVPPFLLPTLLLPPSNSASTSPVVAPPRQADSSASNALPCFDSIKQEIREGLKDGKKKVRSVKEEAQPTDCDSVVEPTGVNLGEGDVKGGELKGDKIVPTVVPEGRKRKSKAAQDTRDGDESDGSVEMVELSSEANQEIIDIEESDNEDEPTTISSVPGHTEPQLKSACVETAGTQTSKFKEEDNERRTQGPAVSAKDAKIPPESSEVVEDEEPFLGTFENHTGPVHGMQVHQGLLYTCSGDNTARAYNLISRECQAVFEGHTNKVNCLLVSSLPNMPARLYTGSSDQTIRSYSIKSKKCLDQISLLDRVLCLHIAWNILYAGLANGSVVSYDLKTLKQLDVFECHGPRGVSCLGTAQEGARRVLLVGSYDSTISVRDAKSSLLLRSLQGHTKTVLCMKVVNDLVFSGSTDTSVHAHNIHTGELVRIYKGHDHAVTSIAILGKVMVTACLDKLVRVYELQSHDRLQVYGGHSDMVMCMAIHKSVIYTGCYDGSVQAVKLNLMKNYRCWWQPCSLIFGMAEHLVQHLVGDHSNPRLQTVKCRWRGCNAFFAQDAVRQELPEHMQGHIEQDSKLEP